MSEELPVGYDPQTLREVYSDLPAARARVARLRREIGSAPDDTAELMARGDLIDLLRGTGELDDALAQARLAVERSELVGSPAQRHTARVRLAQVHQRRGEFVDADMLFIELLAEVTAFGPIIEAFTHQHAGRNDYDQRRYPDAAAHFATALQLRRRYDLPAAEIASSEQALAAARARQEADR